MITRLWTKLHGSSLLATQLRGQRRVPFLPREKLDALRDRRVRQVVTYAARTVPFYGEFFTRERIDPREIRGAQDLERLPLIDRTMVHADPVRFVSDSREARASECFLTTGSTGTPIEIRHDRRSLLANIAFGERERDPVLRACGGSFRPREIYVGVETSTMKKMMAFYEKNALLPVRPHRQFASVLAPIDEVAAIINAERPDVLVGFGGWLDLFFGTIVARNIRVHPPKLVIYVAEALPHGGREFIERTVGIPVFSRYNAIEAFKIGFYCERRAGFHLHEDLCHVRVVGPDGRTLPAGKQGQVVISNLVNRATVLLNYRLGDMASIEAETCACGRTFRLLSELEGRVEDTLPLADGRFVHPRAIWRAFKNDREVLQYQLTQHEPRRFVLTLATVDEPAFERAFARVLPNLQALLGADALVEAKRADVSREPNRKFRAVVSLSKQTTQT